MARFFIDRPIFATVLSILIVLIGAVAYFALPLAQYPNVAPPTINVNATYSGANARAVADSVATQIEDQVNGVEGMLYMESSSTNDGKLSLNVTFETGTNLNDALVLVQNRVSLATSKLPEQVKKVGVTVRKRSPTTLMMVNFISPSKTFDQVYISNFVSLRVRDAISRVEGVGDVSIFGEKSYSMRVWLDPAKMAARKLNASDVVKALEEQNQQVAAGSLGDPPIDEPIIFQRPLNTKGRLVEVEEFEKIVVQTDSEGRVTLLKDVARVELSALDTKVASAFNGLPTVTLSIYQLPDANAVATSERVRAKLAELAKSFPDGIDYIVSYDTTPYVKESIREVKKTLLEAVVLVAIVVILFLQSWRAAIIPLLAVPISLIGTCAAMYALGFSLNNLSLFGLVLAIGIVVDDAIVVVENVERHMSHGLAPREACYKAMQEVSGALVAIALVLASVFIPAACVPGIVGMFYREFALTIAVSTLISCFVSLTLSPALCAILLQRHGARRDPLTWIIDVCFGWFFKLFNGAFNLSTSAYVAITRSLLRISLIVLLVYGGLLYLTVGYFQKTPTGFIPTQDKGIMRGAVQLPDSSSLFRTREMMRKVYRMALETDGVAYVTGIEGRSTLVDSAASNVGTLNFILEPFEVRAKTGRTDVAIQQDLLKKFGTLRDGKAYVFRAAPVDGVGLGGFKLQLEDKSGSSDLSALQEVGDAIVDAGAQMPEVYSLQNAFRGAVPQTYLDIDRQKAKSMNVSLDDVFDTLSVYLGSKYVNDINFLERSFLVKVQADWSARGDAEDVYRLYVRNKNNEMVPLGSLLTARDATGPVAIKRFNMFPSSAISGQATPGVSSGEAMRAMEQLLDKTLPSSMDYEWTELALLEKRAGNTAIYVFVLAVVLVFLLLAALYESWSLPFAIILVVPMCLLCSLLGVNLAHSDMNVFTQIGFFVLIGLACKNAILIVEFAKDLQAHGGRNGLDATLEACRLRLRPIIMTSLAFILGVAPLMYGKGAGHEMRFALGVAVFAGMLGVTLFGLFLTPVFYYVIQRFSHQTRKAKDKSADDAVM
ncbi:MAG: multidrug efflux RND transporter permease subunit [Planctomycetia bacterium]|nr:multidrug efflux RND transporter permease subunit [Planctomycetia bacterium]